jgi:hypothetical protein
VQQHHVPGGPLDGKTTDHWAVRDDAGLMRQLTTTPHQQVPAGTTPAAAPIA